MENQKIFYNNIEELTIKNNNYRNVLYTHRNGVQFVLMSLKPGVEIGMEMHQNHDQFIRIEKGNGKAVIKENGKDVEYKLSDGFAILIPSGTYHNIINTGLKDLKLYSIYTPPEHKQGLIQKDKPFVQEGGFLNYKIKKYNNKIKKLL